MGIQSPVSISSSEFRLTPALSVITEAVSGGNSSDNSGVRDKTRMLHAKTLPIHIEPIPMINKVEASNCAKSRNHQKSEEGVTVLINYDLCRSLRCCG